MNIVPSLSLSRPAGRREGRHGSPACIVFTSLLLWSVIAHPAFAQGEKAGNPKKADEEGARQDETFTPYGPVSVSSKFKLSKDRRHITFRLINNTGRSISNLFGWVYRLEEDEAGGKTRYTLANYPNKGGVCLTSRVHRPAAKAKWRFILRRAIPKGQNAKFVLVVNMNSVFFTKAEPLEPKPEPVPEEQKKGQPAQEAGKKKNPTK